MKLNVVVASLRTDFWLIIYINDLPKCVSKDTTVSMYAEDTAMYTICKDVNELNRILNKDLMTSIIGLLITNSASM